MPSARVTAPLTRIVPPPCEAAATSFANRTPSVTSSVASGCSVTAPLPSWLEFFTQSVPASTTVPPVYLFTKFVLEARSPSCITSVPAPVLRSTPPSARTDVPNVTTWPTPDSSSVLMVIVRPLRLSPWKSVPSPAKSVRMPKSSAARMVVSSANVMG